MIYVFAEVSTYCYPEEVALWIALGRIPTDASWHGVDFNSQVHSTDFRRSWIVYKDGGVGNYEKFPSPDELKLIGVDYRSIDDSETQSAKTKSLLNQALDEARYRVLKGLSKGELKSEGWLPPKGSGRNLTQDDFPSYFEFCINEDHGPIGLFHDIPRTLWSFDRFNWAESKLMAGSVEYKSVQVNVSDMLSLFPAPFPEPRRLEVSNYGDTLVVEHVMDEAEGNESRRGRKRVMDGAIQIVVQNYFADRFKNGILSEKAEALNEEVIEFVKKAFRVQISRSTAQNYLAALRKKS